jgi:hypothetical protein
VRESARQREVDQQIRQHEAEFMRSQEAAERTNAEIDDLTQRFSTREKSAVEKVLLTYPLLDSSAGGFSE